VASLELCLNEPPRQWFVLADPDSSFGEIIVHARAKSAEAGLERIRNTSKAYSMRCDERVQCVTGDLEKPLLGINKNLWENLATVNYLNYRLSRTGY
jgi:thioester reductase-like protein